MNFSLIFICLTIGYVVAAPRGKLNKQSDCGGKPADIYFLLDSSSSIWSVDFKKQLQFLINVTSIFDISPTGTRVGVASFSYRYHQNIDLDDYDNIDDLQQAIRRIRQVFGGTYTYDALDGLRTRGFNPKVARKGVVQIAIVITDGESANSKKTIQAAKKLKASGVVVFAVGIGSKTDEDELTAIASEPADQFLFEIKSYGLLDGIKDRLAIKACEVEATTNDEPAKGPQCGNKNIADVMFLANSGMIGAQNMDFVYNFISNVSKNFNQDNGNIRVGLETKNCGAENIDLGVYTDKAEMVKALRNTRHFGMSHMIKRLRTDAYLQEHGGRNRRARQMAVLFIDDKLGNAKHIFNEARLAKMQDIELFVVGVGDKIDEEELKTLCSSSSDRHFMKVDSYEQLKTLKPEFLEKFCPGL